MKWKLLYIDFALNYIAIVLSNSYLSM